MFTDAGMAAYTAERTAYLTGSAVCPACEGIHPHVTRSPLGHVYATAWSLPPRCKSCGHLLVLPNWFPRSR